MKPWWTARTHAGAFLHGASIGFIGGVILTLLLVKIVSLIMG